MKIKEFAHKYSLTFFWSTIILAIIVLLTICGFSLNRPNYQRDFRDRDFYNRGPGMMNRYGYPDQYRNRGNAQTQNEQISPTEDATSSQTQ